MSVIENEIMHKFFDRLLELGKVDESLAKKLGDALKAERLPKPEELTSIILEMTGNQP